MKKRFIFNVIGIALVVILIVLINYITVYLLDNLEASRLEKISGIEVKEELQEQAYIPKKIDEKTIGEILNKNSFDSLYPVSRTGSEIINMEQAINIAIDDLNTFKENGILFDKIDLNQINQTYAELLVSTSKDVLFNINDKVEFSILTESNKIEDSETEKTLENLEKKYYFWNVKFVGEDIFINLYIHADTGTIWAIEVESQNENAKLSRTNEEIINYYAEYLNLETEPSNCYILNENVIVIKFKDFAIKTCVYIEDDVQLIRIGITNETGSIE